MDEKEKISVLIVDDSAFMRSIVSKIVERDPRLRVMDKAMNGRFAFQSICISEPDVIILDIAMPEMNGIQFLKKRQEAGIKIPVIILSSFAHQGAAVTIECLELGAADFITKPSSAAAANIECIAEKLISLLVGFGGRYRDMRLAGKTKPIPPKILKEFDVSAGAQAALSAQQSLETQPTKTKKPSAAAKPAVKLKRKKNPGKIEIIAIGVSTGGPNALREVFPKLNPRVVRQPIVVVQHMPPDFTEEFANSLNKVCPLTVKEAEEGDLLKAGRVLIAPGDKHITVEKKSNEAIVHITDSAPRNGHRPSADVLFESVWREYGNNALGIIMTGMGKDGAEELAHLYEEGSRTLGQDEESCIVYGMPRAAAEMGALDEQVSLEDMAETINRYAKEFG